MGGQDVGAGGPAQVSTDHRQTHVASLINQKGVDMPNPFMHVELQTKDVDNAKEFYQSIFDWKFEDMPMDNGMSYTGIVVGEGTGGGMWTNPANSGPAHWLAYVNVD